MWLQFTRRTHCQIPFIYYPKISSKVRLMRKIKNREIFLVQISTRPFPKHIYRSLRALLNSTLTRNEFGSFQIQTLRIITNCYWKESIIIKININRYTIIMNTQRNSMYNRVWCYILNHCTISNYIINRFYCQFAWFSRQSNNIRKYKYYELNKMLQI